MKISVIQPNQCNSGIIIGVIKEVIGVIIEI
jgi:hypothetical protein